MKNTLRKWAEEKARRGSAQTGEGKSFPEQLRKVAAEALDCFLQIPDGQFDASTRTGMFGEKVSLWKEMGQTDFLLRSLPQACGCVSGKFRCDVHGLDVFQIMLYNGCVNGPQGKNLLFPEEKAQLDDRPCVCRLSDLEKNERNTAKLNGFFAEAEAGLRRREENRKVKTTADFAKGGREEKTEQSKWLNRALSEDVLVIYLPAGYRLEKPLQIVSLNHSGQPAFITTQCWVLLEEKASLSLVQCTDSEPNSDVLAHTLTEIRMLRGSHLENIQLQNVGNRCKIFHNLSAHLDQAACLTSYSLTLNGGMTQNNIEVNLDQSEAKAELLGLYLQDKQQMVNNCIKVNHYAPRTYSRELFKGVMDDSGQSFFKGHVFVSPEAEQTEAYQTNRNLLISSKAQAYAKPYLEIYADDVQCNHGVTVGQLDEDALFYMRCRGIPAAMARRLLMRAYADEILSPISVESVRDWMTFLVKKRFSGQLQACEECVLACSDKPCLSAE